MSEKRVHEYEVLFKHLRNNKGEHLDRPPIEFLFQNHDDIDSILEKLTERK